MAESTTESAADALSVRLRQPLDRFTLEVAFEADAPIVCLYGPSGSGKSSCLELIAGVRRPAAGRIVVGPRTLYDDRTIFVVWTTKTGKKKQTKYHLTNTSIHTLLRVLAKHGK